MYISKQAKEQAKIYLKLCLSSGSFDEAKAKSLVEYTIKNSSKLSLQTLSYFYQLVKLELNKETAKIESAEPIQEPILQEISRKLETIYKRKVRLNQSNAPKLIGGFKVTIGSDVYDFSLENRLRQIKEAISK